MTIEEQLQYLSETTKADIDQLSARDRLNYFQTILEFVRPKMQRSTFQTTDKEENQIKLLYENFESDKGLSGIVEESEEN